MDNNNKSSVSGEDTYRLSSLRPAVIVLVLILLLIIYDSISKGTASFITILTLLILILLVAVGYFITLKFVRFISVTEDIVKVTLVSRKMLEAKQSEVAICDKWNPLLGAYILRIRKTRCFISPNISNLKEILEKLEGR